MTTPPAGDAARRPDARRDPPAVVTNRIELPTRTIVKVLVTLALLWVIFQIHGILIELFVASLLAAALYPPVRWLRARGLGRAPAILSVLAAFIAILVAFVVFIGGPLVREAWDFVQALPTYVQDGQRFLNSNPDLYNRLRSQAQSASADPSTLLTDLTRVGSSVAAGVTATLLTLIMTVYILFEGERALRWLTRDLAERHRRRLDRLLPELITVVSGYVRGQVITSAIFGVYVYALLRLTQVPQPLLLAFAAALLDALPIVGVLLAGAIITLVALTVSLQVAIIVLVAFVVFHNLETYLIVPRVYQGTLEISSFAVLISVLIGTELLGILGAILALPVAASIPVFERIWLDREVPEQVERIEMALSESRGPSAG